MDQANEPIKVLIVDDHEVVRVGLKAILDSTEGLTVVGEAGNARQAVEAVARWEPDVVVMDIRMPGEDGIAACREIRAKSPNTKVIMLTSYASEEEVVGAVLAGASGYVLKQVGSEKLIEAIKAAQEGQATLDPSVTAKVLGRLRDALQSPLPNEESLTPQERRILALIADGHTNRQIAAELHLSEKTVRNYVSAILSKLQLENRTQAAALAIRMNLTE